MFLKEILSFRNIAKRRTPKTIFAVMLLDQAVANGTKVTAMNVVTYPKKLVHP